MVDASDRFDPAPIAAKLADITVTDRHLRVYETGDPNLLLVKEKNLRGNHEYAIERDEGLVADLKLFTQAPCRAAGLARGDRELQTAERGGPKRNHPTSLRSAPARPTRVLCRWA